MRISMRQSYHRGKYFSLLKPKRSSYHEGMVHQKSKNIERIFLDRTVKNAPLTHRILRELKGIPVSIITDKEAFLENVGKIPLTAGKKQLWLTRFKGDFLKPCPATGPDYICCRYWTINAQTHCPLDCTYCILQNYLTVPLITVYANIRAITQEIDKLVASRPGRLFRMGTGELTDSLAFDPVTHLNEHLIRHALKKKMIFEIKTKMDLIGHLPKVPKRNILISWSLNPKDFIRTQEFKSASLENRLSAASQAVQKGYRLGFHLDPLLMLPGWEAKYNALIQQWTRKIPEDEVAWISLGSLRFPAPLKKIIGERFPKTAITAAEFVKGLDGKMRYFRPERVKLYRHILGEIRKRWKNVFVYFCMENKPVWQEVMGFSPENNAHLDFLFHQSLAERFPDLKLPRPARKNYSVDLDFHEGH